MPKWNWINKIELFDIVSYWYLYIYQKKILPNIPFFYFPWEMTFPSNLWSYWKVFKIFKNQTLPLIPLVIYYISSICILLSPNICTFWDINPFRHSYPKLSLLANLNFLTWRTPKFDFPKILPGTLSPTQIKPKEPKRYQIDNHLDYETGVHILLVKATHRCFDFSCYHFGRFFKKRPLMQPPQIPAHHKDKILW